MGDRVSVVALSSAPVDTLLWQRPPHAPVLTIVCRATFTLQPGEARLAPEQEPLATAERPYPDGASRGVHSPCDLVPMKPRADVLLVGHAFAPGGQPVRSLVARLAVGEVEKRVEIFCDWQFDQQGALREGPRFTTMPLVYERAAGGPDTGNPLGVRPDVRDAYGRLTLPNLQPMGLEIATPADFIAPVGFGPLAGAWPARRALLGPTACAQSPGPWQGPLVPADLDPSHFHAAPPDQQMQALRGDERIALDNLHPQHPELVTRLPGVRPRTFVEGHGGAPQGISMRADTLWIDTSRQICTVTWRGQLPLEPSSSGLRVLVALELPDRPLAWEDLQRMAAATAPRAAAVTMFGLEARLSQTPAMPFATPAPAPRATREPVVGSGLPFHRPGESAPPPATAPPRLGDETVDQPMPAALATLPLPPTAPPTDSPWARGAPAVAPAQGAPVPFTPAQGAPLPFAPAQGAPVPFTPAPLPFAPAPAAPAQGARPEPVAPAGAPLPVARPQAAPAPRAAMVDALQLLWFEPAILPPLRKDLRFSPLLEALDERPLDGDLDDPELVTDATDVEERREAFEILALGGAVDEAGVVAALAGAAREDGRLLQPIVLVTGELVLGFDELTALKATISAAAPSAGADLEARAILNLAKEFLGSAGQPSAPDVAAGLATRIRETFERRGLVAAGFLDAQITSALLAGRHYERRALLGGSHVRALFHTGSPQGIPVYLGREAAEKLPGTARLRARMLAVVHPALDQHETHPAALRAVALGVINPLARR